jgi:hypothetical protein
MVNPVIMFVGFVAFCTGGCGEGGRVIDPGIMPVVIVHGVSITGWYILSLVQSLLITVKNRRVHMKLGWSAPGFGPVFVLAAIYLVVRSAMTRKFDRPFATGHAAMIVAYLTAEQLSRTDAWRCLAMAFLTG